MPVAAELPQERARVPEREAGLVGPLHRGMGREQRAAGGVASRGRVARERRGLGDVDVVEQASQRVVERVEAGLHDDLGRGDCPRIGDGAGDHAGREVEERRLHDRGRHRPHGRGASREVAHPEALQPDRGARVSRLGREVDDRVEGLGGPPHAARQLGVHDPSRVASTSRATRSPERTAPSM